MSITKQAPSVAARPDLDWSQVRETVRMLYLATVQIDMALHEGDASIETLSENFTSMIGCIDQITRAVDDISRQDENAEIIADIEQKGDEISASMQQSIVAFQFYDRLSQRLTHVTHALQALSELVGDQGRIFNPGEWTKLQETIRGRYSMKEEQEMFDLLLNGATIEEALDHGKAALHQESQDDIELF